jgi:hypothetical protein
MEPEETKRRRGAKVTAVYIPTTIFPRGQDVPAKRQMLNCLLIHTSEQLGGLLMYPSGSLEAHIYNRRSVTGLNNLSPSITTPSLELIQPTTP